MDVDSKTPSTDIGKILSEARKSKGLAVEDIAKRLHLSIERISSIESNNFELDIPVAFVRGYIQSYSKVVEANTEVILSEFDKAYGESGETLRKIEVLSSYKHSPRELNSNSLFFKIVTFFILVSIMAFAVWAAWMKFYVERGQPNSPSGIVSLDINNSNGSPASTSDNFNSTDVGQDDEKLMSDEMDEAPSIDNASSLIDTSNPQLEKPAMMANSSEETQSLEGTGSLEGSDASDGDDLDEPLFANSSLSELSDENNLEIKTSDLKQNEELTVSENSILTDDEIDEKDTEAQRFDPSLLVPVEFKFSGECWVQVKDATGEILAIGIKRVGKVMLIEGYAPFEVIIGAPAVVELTYKGLPYDLSRFNPQRSATFKLE